MAGNFAALWPTDFKFSATKDLNLLKKHTKNHEDSNNFRIDFALSKWPHLHRAYLLTVCNQSFIAVYEPHDTDRIKLECKFDQKSIRVMKQLFHSSTKSLYW